jgi:hypothetical protein
MGAAKINRRVQYRLCANKPIAYKKPWRNANSIEIAIYLGL